ncbi:ABC-2 type transport system ATP-binding protein [Tessaracoccus bendigoensis DSM 12906]|uniref:ABC-2 type transport system ATP-binding protein n=1 Tax=Tessaracoccus bendigoensis DSM 12906 TaxID=1123357 RepID=A0A1M6BJD5_9ACTN|nr:ATP-binding cassette domain-containing protein [Tessaracoccus bendigoensis]SHI48825.1 ABC-2 type transport system ATP-binding protein [Tessaracoccus bendigoensis DSM 12906]
MKAVIEAEAVGKTYGRGDGEVGLHRLSLELEQGRVLALLGPNGAGKTTAVRGLSTLLRFDRGNARVAGYDVSAQPKQVRQRIALVGQSAAVDEQLTAIQNLVLFARLRGLDRSAAMRRAQELTGQFGLTEAATRAVQGFSGGMRRRLDVAASMIVRPHVLFVDEPTTGLDPAARRDLWRALRSLVADGTAILLTTQYLEEADSLADDIILLDRGYAVAQGSADHLKSMVGPPVIQLHFQDEADAHRAIPLLQDVDPSATLDDTRTTITLHAEAENLTRSVQVLAGIVLPTEVTMRKPSLDEVFLTLTGHDTQAAEEKSA